MVSKVSIVSIVLIVSIVCLSYTLLAYADQYKTLGIKHSTNPQICIFEPDSLYTNDVDGVVQAAHNAINLWKDGLRTLNTEYYSHLHTSRDVTPVPKSNWYMPVVEIPLKYHKYKNASEFPICNILISFEYVNEESRSLGYTGMDFSNSKHKYAHIVVFLKDIEVIKVFDWDLGNLEQKLVRTEINIVPFSLTSIQNTVTHEFGHSLGLGHYLITDAPVSDNPWVTRSVMYYAMNPHSEEIMIPKYVDIKMLEVLYKEDGFGGNTTSGIKIGYYTTGDDEICTFKCQ